MKLRFRKLNRLIAVLVCLLLLCPSALAARTGSLQVEVEDAGSGMTVTLYYVASNDGTLNASFAACGLTGDQLTKESKRPASSIALDAYVNANGLTGTELTTNLEGVVFFDDLSQGIYLVRGEGENAAFEPFLVSIPTKIGPFTVYSVKATPKAETITPTPTPDVPTVTPTPTPTPSEPSVTPSPTPGGTKEPGIPQTGVQVWPIYLLLTLGTLFVVAGALFLFHGRKERHHE